MTHTPSTKILVLPDAGPKNPFQYQMVAFLRENGFEVRIGRNCTLFGIFKAIQTFPPEIMYFDWVHSFILGKSLFHSCIKSAAFVLEIIYLHDLRQIPIVHTVHNIRNHQKKQLALERWVYRFFLSRCFKIRVYSEAVRQEVVTTFGVLPESIDVIQDVPFHHHYPRQGTRKESRILLGIQESHFLYLFFGRIEPYKGLENLIGSFLAIAKTGDRLIIAGEGTDPAYALRLQNLCQASPGIIWHNRFIEKQDVQYFFNAADVVVLPFTRIDHSGSVDLSLSFAKPVITLRTRALSSLLCHQEILLFSEPSQLENALVLARNLDLVPIGKQNFKLACSGNYPALLTLFHQVKSH